ncbi:MAG TPA: NAD(P)-dependent oxidoreductase [Sphingomicrobium sp.]|nr:NAD(P)-dependent oxidoreductase [Sphingomicrobium sp.]
MKLAVTGGTGFVGSHLIEAALAAGHTVRALTRRSRPTRDKLTWVEGDVLAVDALIELVAGCDAVIHAAGVLNPRYASEFLETNLWGTTTLLSAMSQSRTDRLIFVSSLAARAPELSNYGQSKDAAEGRVEELGIDWTIVRPPGVYGPGDRETLALFKMAKRGIVMMPPPGRASYIHVADLARLLLALADPGTLRSKVLEPDDGRPGGWSHAEFAAALGVALGRPARAIHVPGLALKAAAQIAWAVAANRSQLTPDRASYFCHPDWVVDPARAPPASLWQAQIATPQGLAETAAWYRAKNWL